MTDLANRFERIGLTAEKAAETAGNKKLGPVLASILDHAGVSNEVVPKAIGVLYYNLATSGNKVLTHLAYLSKEIASERLRSTDQVTAAIKFFERVTGDSFDTAAYEEECGVGVNVSDDDAKRAVAALIDANAARVDADRYRSLGFLLGQARASPLLRWANTLVVKQQVEEQLAARLGPKDERDDPKLLKKKGKDDAAAPAKATGAAAAATTAAPDEPKLDPEAMLRAMFFEGEMSRLHKPGENPQTDPALMRAHLAATGGKVVTRFPPEPNGFLHIGHTKAINIDFGYAQVHDGHCYLRFDDTNPDAEEQRYFETIEETVRWLGFTPWKITYSSDYFDKLYDLAIELVRYDKAYVCHCTGEEIFEQRGGASKGPRTECVHRNRPIEESVREFERMRQGRYAEGEAILRMKMDMTSGNPQFWDLAAYRIKYTPHYRTGAKWCIYPTYDYTHCLVDSLENITHSLCTLEFRQSRESYYWLVDALKLYKPVQWESGRLNINNTVMSKRKLKKLVDTKVVRGWDDPRIYTIGALRRRGFPAMALNMFVRSGGVTTSNTLTDVSRLDYYVRQVLNDSAPRLFAVLEPIKVTIQNLPENHQEWIDVPNNPRDPAAGTRRVPFTRTLYIERDDFRTVKSKDFYRLTPGQAVGLAQVPFPISYVSHKTDAGTGEVTEVVVKYENAAKEPKKPKTYIHWVAHAPKLGSPVRAQTRVYSALFRSEFPDNAPEGWLSDIDHDSLLVRDALVEIGVNDHVASAKAALKASKLAYSSSLANPEHQSEATDAQLRAVEPMRFQFTRVGYFCVDPDSDLAGDKPASWKLVFNKTIGLKEDAKK
ncbi:tRNA synthetases class I, catalytic domain-containing protein [Blastocladiella britannica]|nr:tRNA synthetases class I, catalytic domain-containing protein [Blastocladiella britannica]